MAVKTFVAPSSMHREWFELFACYVLAGALHEAAHIFSVVILVDHRHRHHHDFLASDSNWTTFLFQTLFLRQTVLSEHMVLSEDQITVCRHVGWIFSLLLAIACCRWFQTKPTTRIAVTLTALEALSTDLFGMYFHESSSSNNTVFFCGNFGILLLHEAWSKADNGKTALDILETMIGVTMVRGAQSGGVISFDGKSGRATRVRVVNRKRTDLSQLLRQKMASEISFRSSPVPFILGHTRFATSSKSTLDGTHPHRWTPPSWRRVYDWNMVAAAAAAESFLEIKANRVRVENFVTHNGTSSQRNSAVQSCHILKLFSTPQRSSTTHKICISIVSVLQVISISFRSTVLCMSWKGFKNFYRLSWDPCLPPLIRVLLLACSIYSGPKDPLTYPHVTSFA